nr:hypothetical protein [uncultured Draconibacterium sp.]
MRAIYTFSFSILLIINTLSVFAQNRNTFKPDLGIYSGLSIPIGDFKSTSLSNWEDHYGGAKTNGSFALKLRFPIKNRILGIVGLQRTWNAYDAKPITDALYTAFNSPFSVETDSWKSSILELGVGYSFAFEDNNLNEWEFAIEAGGLYNNLSTYSYRIYSPVGTNRYPLRQESVDDPGVGYFMGAGIRYTIANFVGIRLTTDYITSAHNVSNVERRYNGGDLLEVGYKQKVEAIVVQLGLVIILN